MLSGDNGILQKATDAKTNTDNSQIQERINLAYNSALTSGLGEVEEGTLKDEIKKEFNKTDSELEEENWLDKTSMTGKWKITIDGVSLDVPAGRGSQPQVDPAVKYGYANKEGTVVASTLEPGDVINYYYDENEDPIECVVLYGSNSENGLQVVSLDSVRNVVLGYDDTAKDPKAIEAFADKDNNGEEDPPIGYNDTTNFEKTRWSYNHIIETLNGYAQDYLGDMAVSARCVGTLVDSIVLSETEEKGTMFTANASYTYFENYNGLFKDEDSNVNYDIRDNVNVDLNTMHELKVIQTPNQSSSYWLASRKVVASNYVTDLVVCIVDDASYINTVQFCAVAPNDLRYCTSNSVGFRPIFLLRSDIQVEKIVDAEDFTGTGGFSESDSM